MTKKEQSRIKIMHAAKILLEKQGIGNVTFDRIAEQVDMCRTTIFNHFATTSDLLFAIYTDEIKDLEKVCTESEEKGLPLIRKLFSRLIDDTICYPALTMQLITNAILKGPENNPLKSIENLVEVNLKEAGCTNPDAVTIRVTGAYYGLLNHYMINGKPFIKKDIVNDLDNILQDTMEV